jgi:hypothetical protein
MVRAVTTLWISILRSCAALFRSREEQAIIELALRQQLAVYARQHPRPRLAPLDRAFCPLPAPLRVVRDRPRAKARPPLQRDPRSHAACWVIQQLRDAFPNGPTHRFMVFDNDAIFSPRVADSIRGLGLAPKRTPFRSPWQNGAAERFVGSARRLVVPRPRTVLCCEVGRFAFPRDSPPYKWANRGPWPPIVERAASSVRGGRLYRAQVIP